MAEVGPGPIAPLVANPYPTPAFAQVLVEAIGDEVDAWALAFAQWDSVEGALEQAIADAWLHVAAWNDKILGAMTAVGFGSWGPALPPNLALYPTPMPWETWAQSAPTQQTDPGDVSSATGLDTAFKSWWADLLDTLYNTYLLPWYSEPPE